MVHYENEINQSLGHSILECLDTVELTVHPSLVPVWENKRLNTNLVDFKSLAEYTAKSNASTLNEAMENIKKYNHTDRLTVCIDEAYIYDNPAITALFEDFVVKPVSKDSIEYQLAEEYLTKYFNTQDPEVLNEYNEITGLNIGTDILNEISIDMMKKLQAGRQKQYSQAMAKGDSAAVKKYQAKADKAATTIAQKQAELKQLQSDMSNRQYDDVDEKNKMQARINNLSGVRTAPKPATTSTNNSSNAANVVGDVASSLANASGNTQGPSWLSRNFAAFKNWMNNTFGTKFNTSIGGFNNYKDFAANAAMNLAGTQTGKNIGNAAVNKGKELADKYGGKYANDIKSGIDMLKDVAGGFLQPSNAATEITAGQILSEVYRPRRMYRSTYMRMH